jgi:hypothetical protein
LNGISSQSLEEYLLEIASKGFKLRDEAIGFIYFGKKYTDAKDIQVIAALKITLQAKKMFDGSFYLSLVELFCEKEIHSMRKAELVAESVGLWK